MHVVRVLILFLIMLYDAHVPVDYVIRSCRAMQGSKAYRAEALFGHETDTQDAEGEATLHGKWEHVTKEAVQGALGQFVGDILQVPPMFSALHKDGKRLYELARQGVTVRVLGDWVVV